MTPTQLPPQVMSRGRPTKFTPERIQQISNLVERGKGSDEIAEIIGVTTDTLQVACSKLGISLRRRTFGTGVLSLSHRRAPSHQANPCRENTIPNLVKGPQPVSAGKPIGEANAAPSEGARQGRSNDPASADLAIRLNYRNEERLTSLPLDPAMIKQLVLEAEIRGMRIGELFAALIFAIIKNDLFHLIRDHWCRTLTDHSLRTPTKPN